jgi:hypothetical protein
MGRNIHIRAAYRYLCQSLSLEFSFDLAGHRNALGCDWFPGSIHDLYGCISFRYAKTASPSYASLRSLVRNPPSAAIRLAVLADLNEAARTVVQKRFGWECTSSEAPFTKPPSSTVSYRRYATPAS